MKYALILFVSVFLYSIPATGLECEKKIAIKRASDHFDMGLRELHEAENMCWYIPDFNIKNKAKILIGSVIASTQVSDFRAAVLCITLPLLADLLINMSDTYTDICNCLARAEYHLRMSKNYNELSLKVSGNIDEGTEGFFGGIDCLTRAITEIQSIHPEYGNQSRDLITKSLNNIRLDFFNNQTNLYERAYHFYENFHEIIIGLEPNFKNKVFAHIKEMVKRFRDAEYYWLTHTDRELTKEEKKDIEKRSKRGKA